jgi:hypothetical protein
MDDLPAPEPTTEAKVTTANLAALLGGCGSPTPAVETPPLPELGAVSAASVYEDWERNWVFDEEGATAAMATPVHRQMVDATARPRLCILQVPERDTEREAGWRDTYRVVLCAS